MKVTAEPLPERQVRLQIEVDDERHAEAMEAAYKRLAPRVQIRGFRPGKAPRPMIEKQIGHHRLLDEAMDILVPKAYEDAVKEQELEPVAQPAVELVSHEPLVFTATVPLTPVIDLGDYKALTVEREKPSVSEDEVEESITELRRRYGTIEPVDREAAKGDIIRGFIKAEAEDAILFEQDELEFRLTDEQLAQLPGLADAIVGLKKGDEVTKTAEALEDFGDTRIAGKTITYAIRVDDVKEQKLAPLDDSFAKEVGEHFESLAALRQRVTDDLQAAKDEAALRSFETASVDALVGLATLEYPGVLLEREVDHILDDQAGLDPRDPRAVELYLQRVGKSEVEVRESVREEAERRLRQSLVLSEFAEAENITVEESEVDEELQKMAASAGEQSEMILRLFSQGGSGHESLHRSLHTRKTLGRLVEITSGEPGQDAAAETAASARPPKRRRTEPRQAETEETAEEAVTQETE